MTNEEYTWLKNNYNLEEYTYGKYNKSLPLKLSSETRMRNAIQNFEGGLFFVSNTSNYSISIFESKYSVFTIEEIEVDYELFNLTNLLKLI